MYQNFEYAMIKADSEMNLSEAIYVLREYIVNIYITNRLLFN